MMPRQIISQTVGPRERMPPFVIRVLSVSPHLSPMQSYLYRRYTYGLDAEIAQPIELCGEVVICIC